VTFYSIRAGLAALAGLAVAFGLMAFAEPARAADGLQQKAIAQSQEAMAAKDPQTTSAITSNDLPSNCQRSRKKLWVQDEGWIVRKVTTCY